MPLTPESLERGHAIIAGAKELCGLDPHRIEKARKVANDINEDIDCGESRKELREVIATLADLEMHAYERGRQIVLKSLLGTLPMRPVPDVGSDIDLSVSNEDRKERLKSHIEKLRKDKP